MSVYIYNSPDSASSKYLIVFLIVYHVIVKHYVAVLLTYRVLNPLDKIGMHVS